MTIEANTQNGRIQGKDKNGLKFFLGIPYAQAPTGKLRFKRPQPLDNWEGIKDAQQFKPGAIQPKSSFFGVPDTAEDCLYLNVTTPETDTQKRPVMVWIHGGSFVSGASSQAVYNATTLVDRGNIVVVTVNYRLGALGFSYLNDLVNDSRQVDSNLGLRDQIAALQWVQDNIENFGGDKNNVTVFGESAGAMSIGCLLASPLAKGLFHKAIIQSGSADQFMSTEDASKIARHWLEAMNIEASQLWDTPADTLLAAQNQCFKLTVSRGEHDRFIPQFGMPFFPVLDGDVLPESPMAVIERGERKEISVLIGTTGEEWNFFLFAPGKGGQAPKDKIAAMSPDDLTKVFERNLPGLGVAARDHYLEHAHHQGRLNKQAEDHYDPVATFIQFESDRIFRIPSIRLAEAQSKHQDNTYMYLLNWNKGTWGACHAVDIPMVFGGVNNNFGAFLTGGSTEAKTLQEKTSDAWIAFAKTGNPKTENLPDWKPYNNNERYTQILDDKLEVVSDPLGSQRKFWDGVL